MTTKTVAQQDREFLQSCVNAGWSYSDGTLPSVHGTHCWNMAMKEAREWKAGQDAMLKSVVQQPVSEPIADLSFEPDWSAYWTAKEAEEQLTGFKFDGPGWYLTKTESTLVLPVNTPQSKVWHQKGWPEDQQFRFLVYDGRNPFNAFNLLIHAPERLDTR